MANSRDDDGGLGMLSMDTILNGGFWDNVLVPGKFIAYRRSVYRSMRPFKGYSNAMEGLSGGFVYGVGGSGVITPHLGMTPIASRMNSPRRSGEDHFAQNLEGMI